MSSELARAAYETLEPYHVLAYFNPYLKDAAASQGLDELGLYFGGRGAPLGRCTAPVVAATFYNFNPAYVNHGWNAALTAGLPQVEAARTRALDHALRDALGDVGADRGALIVGDQLHAVPEQLRDGALAPGAAEDERDGREQPGAIEGVDDVGAVRGAE